MYKALISLITYVIIRPQRGKHLTWGTLGQTAWSKLDQICYVTELKLLTYCLKMTKSLVSAYTAAWQLGLIKGAI